MAIGGSPYTSTVGAGTPTQYLVTSSSYAPTAGSDVTITAQLADVYGNPARVGGLSVTWSSNGTGGSFSRANSPTTGNGIATVTFTTGTTPGTNHTVTGNDGTHSGTSPTITTG